MTTPTTLLLRAIWGSAPNDLFIVGEAGTILRYDGVRWYEMDSPTTVALRSVWGTGPTDVYAAGDEGVLLHFDGAAWTPVPSPTDRLLIQLWGAPGDADVFAVGVVTTILNGSNGLRLD